jgi:Protein of unknown function (DUF3618)
MSGIGAEPGGGGGVSEQGVPKTADGRADIAALREEIRLTRAELGETVEALAAKADVKSRLKHSAEQKADQAMESVGYAVALARGSLHQARESARRRPVPWLAIAGGAAALLVVIMMIRRRR